MDWARWFPDTLTRELLLQLPDASSLPGDLAMGGDGVGLGGVDLAEKVSVAIEERAVDALRGRWPTR
jgi:hypothetical protein